MTGEYCSQKTNIQHGRKKLYKKNENGITISAFVIMNFSDMADVVYKWRIEVFVQSIKNICILMKERTDYTVILMISLYPIVINF